MDKKEFYISVECDLKLWVETYGDNKNEACLFVSGAGSNCSFWSERLCYRLARLGFYVIKYDHRDIGYSSKVDYCIDPYDVTQLTEDVLIILDSLNVKRSHVIGHSMGGFIVQLLGIHYPERVLSMTSISSSTNSSDVPLPPEETWKIFLENNPKNDFENDLKGFLPVWKHLNGTAKFNEKMATEYTKNLYERQDIAGALGESHVKAQANLTDRTELLKKVKLPTLVMHGEEDYLVDKYGGIQTAECIENAELVLIPKMGHLPFNYKILHRFEKEIAWFLFMNRSKESG